MLDLHSYVFCTAVGWSFFSNIMQYNNGCQVVFALGFVRVHDKSIVRDTCHGPGQDLSRLIRTLCSHGAKLFLQDNDLKSVIEEKLVSIFP
jgi:hypothetical protein